MAKPKIRKTESGWVINRPGYGFVQASSDSRPYGSMRRAFHAAISSETLGAYPSTTLVVGDRPSFRGRAAHIRLEVSDVR